MDRRLGVFEWAAVAAVVAVAVGAPLKGRLGLPFDLTVAAAVVVVLVAAGRVVGRERIPPGAGFMAVPAVLMAPSLLGASFDDYTTRKALLFFTVTVGAGVAVAVLRRNHRWTHTVLLGFCAAAVVVALLVIPTEGGRVSLTEGGDPISTARTIATGLVVLVVLALSHRRLLFPAGAAAVVCVAPLLRTGARGPLLAAGVALAVVALAGRPSKRWVRTLLVVGALVAGGWYGLNATSEQTQERLTTFESGTRTEAITEGRAAIPSHPFGVGIGDFSEVVPIGLDYPHNLWIEVTLEAGWLPGVGMVVWSGVVVVRAWRRAPMSPDHLALLGLVVFWMLNAGVSGDLNSNRAVFVVAGLAAVRTPPLRTRSDQRSPATTTSTPRSRRSALQR